MNTKTLLVLLSTLGAVGGLPAMTMATMASEHQEQHDFDADRVLSQLRARGVNAVGVEQWGALIRAYVEVDGRQVMQFFDPDTLQPVDA